MRPLPIALVALAALLAAGCGPTREPDQANGKTLFVEKCGSCHTLKRANTKGVQGPNLDNAFAQARRDGMTDDTIKGIVYRQIGNVRRNSIMPRNLVTGNNRRDVAAYVGQAASEPGQDKGRLAQAGKPKGAGKTVKATGGKLNIDSAPGTALAFSAGKILAPAGALELIMKNVSSGLQHNIAVEGNGIDKKGKVVGKGGVSMVSAKLKPGKYTFLCTVPGHAAGGMKGTLTVK